MMVYCCNDGIGLGQVVLSNKIDIVFMFCFYGVGDWIMDDDCSVVGFQFVNDIDDVRILQVRVVFFKSQVKNNNWIIFYGVFFMDQLFDGLFGYEFVYVVVDLLVGQDNFGVIVEFLGFVCQVIGVDVNVVFIYQFWVKWKEILFCIGCL